MAANTRHICQNIRAKKASNSDKIGPNQKSKTTEKVSFLNSRAVTCIFWREMVSTASQAGSNNDRLASSYNVRASVHCSPANIHFVLLWFHDVYSRILLTLVFVLHFCVCKVLQWFNEIGRYRPLRYNIRSKSYHTNNFKCAFLIFSVDLLHEISLIKNLLKLTISHIPQTVLIRRIL